MFAGSYTKQAVVPSHAKAVCVQVNQEPNPRKEGGQVRQGEEPLGSSVGRRAGACHTQRDIRAGAVQHTSVRRWEARRTCSLTYVRKPSTFLPYLLW